MTRVLVAEDDSLMRWSLERILAGDGHVVHSVDSGKAAIAAAGRNEYRVVVTDYRMEAPNGLDILWWVKTHIPQTHVIVITAHATPELERFVRNIGAFDFFEKPFELAAMKRSVKKACGTPERRRGPRGCCSGCHWQQPCGVAQRPRVH
jgi:DNA-binding NtrC family response regulator